MFNTSPSFLSSPSSPQHSLIFLIALCVIASHLGLLALGTLWNPASPASKPRTKVVVQTISLKPMQATTREVPSLTNELPTPLIDSPQEEIALESPLIADLLKEEIPIKTEDSLKEEPPLKTEESPLPEAKQEAEPQVSSPPAKVENPPKTTSLKPTAQETKKPVPAKQAPPTKKTVETKKAKNETAKPKTSEAEKKKQQERTEVEKKRQQERAEAEKKRQQERAEAEKKRQQEQAEAEKKRQRELAAAQEAARQREQALLNKAKENLAKMSETRDKISTSSSPSLAATTLPKALGDLQVDALPLGEMGSTGEWGAKEISYSDEVASRLKMALRLPDYGAVKIRLTLDRTGKVVKVETVQSESNKNKAYVESKIPTLLFPSFGQRFQGVSQNTFVITLQNDS
jgi:colicin import membrane protein